MLTDGSQLFLVAELVTRRGRRLRRTVVNIMFRGLGQNTKSHRIFVTTLDNTLVLSKLHNMGA